jgi:hypothetical protein
LLGWSPYREEFRKGVRAGTWGGERRRPSFHSTGIAGWLSRSRRAYKTVNFKELLNIESYNFFGAFIKRGPATDSPSKARLAIGSSLGGLSLFDILTVRVAELLRSLSVVRTRRVIKLTWANRRLGSPIVHSCFHGLRV